MDQNPVELWVGKHRDCWEAARNAGVRPDSIRIVDRAEQALGYRKPLRVILCGNWQENSDLRDIVYYFKRLATIQDIVFVDPDKRPYSVTFFPNGMAAVGNFGGAQIGKYQGRHKHTVESLAADGFNWRELPDVMGVPNGAACLPWQGRH